MKNLSEDVEKNRICPPVSQGEILKSSNVFWIPPNCQRYNILSPKMTDVTYISLKLIWELQGFSELRSPYYEKN